jgi:hypothetical protein
VTQNHHLPQGRVRPVRVKALNLLHQRRAQVGDGFHKRVAAPIDKAPSLITITQNRISGQSVGHLGPGDRAGKSAMHEYDRDALRNKRLVQDQLVGNVFARGEEIEFAQFPDRGLVQVVGTICREIIFQR